MSQIKSNKKESARSLNKGKDINDQAIANVIDNIWDKYDVDGSGDLDRDETKQFVIYTMGNLTGGAINESITDEEFNIVFEMFDTDKSGTVEKEEMVAFIKHFLGDGNQDSHKPQVVTSRPSVRGSISNDSIS